MIEWKKHPEYVNFLREYIPNHSNRDIKEEFSIKFGIILTVGQISGFKTQYKVLSGMNPGWFKKGHTANKGKKLSKGHYEKSSKTMFKKGHISHNCKKLNSEHLSKKGYVFVKVPHLNTWKLKHRIVWESEYGEIPKGCKIVFLDGNRENTDISNLALVTQAEQVKLNTDGFHNCKNPELTKSRIQLAKLKLEIGKKKKRYKKILQHID